VGNGEIDAEVAEKLRDSFYVFCLTTNGWEEDDEIR